MPFSPSGKTITTWPSRSSRSASCCEAGTPPKRRIATEAHGSSNAQSRTRKRGWRAAPWRRRIAVAIIDGVPRQDAGVVGGDQHATARRHVVDAVGGDAPPVVVEEVEQRLDVAGELRRVAPGILAVPAADRAARRRDGAGRLARQCRDAAHPGTPGAMPAARSSAASVVRSGVKPSSSDIRVVSTVRPYRR